MRIGFTCSSFDLLHAGHTLMLEEAKAQCDYLIVGLQTDPSIDRPTKNKPVQTVVERYLQLRACKYVDEIIPYETESDLLEILKGIDYDVRFVGDDWRDKPFTGHDLPGHLDKVMYNSRKHDYSSSALRRRVAEGEKLEKKKKSQGK